MKSKATDTAVTIPVSGLTCASCVVHVREALEEQPGVSAADVNLVTREARVAFDPSRTTAETLVTTIRNRGYGAEAPVERANPAEEQAAQEEAQAQEFRDLRVKGIASGVLGAAAMLLSMPLMSGGDHSAHGGGDPLLGPMMNLIEPPVRRAVPWLYAINAATLKYTLLLLTVLVIGWTGRQFYTRHGRHSAIARPT